MGQVAAACGQAVRAVRLFAAAATLREVGGLVLPPVAGAEYDHGVAVASSQLDESAFRAAWTEGQAMTLEQAFAYALHDEE